MKNDKGQALIEMALLLPLLLVLVFGMIDYGRIVYARNALITAARYGARTAALTPGMTAQASISLASPTSATAIAVKNNLYMFRDEDISSMSCQLDILNAAAAPGTSVAGAATPGNQVKVTVTWPNFPMITPFNQMMSLLTQSPTNGAGLTLWGQASMRYE